MLILCPECALQVSDKALSCPHCGYPLQKTTRTNNRKYSKSKRKRLPNGFGSITEIKNTSLRCPFRALVTVGKDENGRPIRKMLKPKAYFETYNDAYIALIEYHKNPYDLDNYITMGELFDRWFGEYSKTLAGDSSRRTVTSAWAYCSSIKDVPVKTIRARHLKGCMEDGTITVNGEERHASPSTKSRMKSLFNLMLDYAVEYEICNRNYARTFNISDDIIKECNDVKRGHITFTDNEMRRLWDTVNSVEYVDMILIQCYSGWRPQELCKLKISDVDLDKWTFKGGMKTEAGTNRVVPIHEKIKGLVKNRYDQAVTLGSEYLFNTTDATTHKSNITMTYDKYRHRFNKIVKELSLNPDHRAHDPRKQFVTMAKKYDVDEHAIKYIVGHKETDITESVYTVRDPNWLAKEISKIS